jgi:hypothetical protein
MNRNLVSLLTYTAALSQLKSLPQSLIQQMSALPGVRICDLKLTDLVLPANQCNGIYFFVSPNDNVVYVGKASSRSFVERLGGHFDLRAGNWFSSFLRAHAKVVNNVVGNLSSEDYEKSYNDTLDYRLKILAIDVPVNTINSATLKQTISLLERLFIKHYKAQTGITVLNR